MDRALDLVEQFPVPNASAAVLVDGEVVDSIGDVNHRYRLASLTKTITTWAVLIAVEEGIVDLDDEVGPPPATGRRTLLHLLTHAGGYGFDTPAPIVSPERNRIYSNTGIEVAADHVARAAGMDFADYLRVGVIEPLGMDATELHGSPAHAMWSTVTDVTRFLREVNHPTLVSPATAAAALRPHFTTLGGIVPGVGRYETCPWGMGFEVRGDKDPHWTGRSNSAATVGHFGGAGTMMWLDPDAAGGASIGLVALTDRSFDEWANDALRLWPLLSDAVLAQWSGAR